MRTSSQTPNDIRLKLPRPHPGQREIIDNARRFNVIDCGRRWGKTLIGGELAAQTMLAGQPIGWFAPTYKLLSDAWREVKTLLQPVISDKSETEKRLTLITGGFIDMWSLEDENAGRGRKYKRVIVDEAAMTANLEKGWTESIRPTLTDYAGDAWFLSTPKGQNYFWRLFNMEAPDWYAVQMPTSTNPYIDAEEIDAAKMLLPERVFRQEYLAEFIEESGGVFRRVAEAVDQGRTENEPRRQGRTYTLGVDLARTQDFTVLSCFDDLARQVYYERFNLISWQRQIERVVDVGEQYNAKVVVDSTGVGDPIYEALRKAGLYIEGYQLTSGSKERLIDNLAMMLDNSRVRLMDIPTQTAELQAYQYELTPSRNVRMNAPPGMHDDTVIAAAMGCKDAMADAQVYFFDPSRKTDEPPTEDAGQPVAPVDIDRFFQ
jgi:hypothetical protein